MMRLEDEKAVELVMMFGKSLLFGRFLRELSRDPSIRKSVVRARVRPTGGWMKLVVQGPSERIDEVVRLWRDSIAAFTRLPKVSA